MKEEQPPSPLTAWLAFMRAEDLTPNTIHERRRFYLYVEANVGNVLTVTRPELIAFLGTPEWSNTTRQHYKSALHTLFTWLQDEGFREDNPGARLPRVKARKRTPHPFTIEEIERTLETGAYRRTRMMVALHYYLGMRVHEIAKVHGNDIDWNERTIRIFGKGAKTKYLPLSEEMWTLAETMPRDGYWFPNWRANHLYAAGEGHILSNSVSTIIGNAIKRAGIQGHRPHDLRASMITLQSRAGVDPFVVQQNARHESLDTTAIYRLVDMDEMRAGFDLQPTVAMPTRSGRRRTDSAA
ncbi:tyrosine-type recombinase/integrase [Leifsonia sp. NPDC056824]|uniref:tyrosine-type recombinase/integrase n=1 Tax=Leifsonia sp. NPDC056824 TaxID=3345953 RepID=UPI0036954BB2